MKPVLLDDDLGSPATDEVGAHTYFQKNLLKIPIRKDRLHFFEERTRSGRQICN